jgi:hypothetical protein
MVKTSLSDVNDDCDYADDNVGITAISNFDDDSNDKYDSDGCGRRYMSRASDDVGDVGIHDIVGKYKL